MPWEISIAIDRTGSQGTAKRKPGALGHATLEEVWWELRAESSRIDIDIPSHARYSAEHFGGWKGVEDLEGLGKMEWGDVHDVWDRASMIM